MSLATSGHLLDDILNYSLKYDYTPHNHHFNHCAKSGCGCRSWQERWELVTVHQLCILRDTNRGIDKRNDSIRIRMNTRKWSRGGVAQAVIAQAWHKTKERAHGRV
jgi:hypothetical protein